MINSYFKTARRVITRNKLFSFINIIGLAASMSVGLLFITILSEVFKYDRFHEKKDRIVRVFTDYRDSRDQVRLATSSIDISNQIRDHVPQAEAVTTVGYGFGADFQFEDKVQSLKGFWAQPSFFDVFSFPLIQGDARTALTEPNTMIVTESAALRMFGTTEALGKSVIRDGTAFMVTGLMPDVTKFSHVQFDVLGSFATIEASPGINDRTNVFGNFTYVVMREGVDVAEFQASLDRIAEKQNAEDSGDNKATIVFGLQPLTKIVFFGQSMDNQAGPTMPLRFLWLISGLSIIILITACFNYTNLSVARASTRMREVGIRKVIGAKRWQLVSQFIAESTVISLVALLFAFMIFTVIKPQFLSLTPTLARLFDLNLTPTLIVYFMVFAIATGLVSGLVPGMFFSKVNAAYVLRGASGQKGASRMVVRKALVVTQYVFALAFITATVILYKQYTDFVKFDLGFNTNNVLNIRLRAVNPEVLKAKLAELPEVKDISGSSLVTSIGDNNYTYVAGLNPNDSVRSWFNKIDENYLALLEFKLLAGRNLTSLTDGATEHEVIVNKKLMSQMNLADDPEKALGTTVKIGGNELTIVGVVDDFHYSTLDRPIGPFLFRQLDKARTLNVRIATDDLTATMARIDKIWKTIDESHPLEAVMYDDQIEAAYRQYSSIGKVVGFLAFLTVIICSLGLLGMVIFSADTRMKEMSIRRVLGAKAWNVTYLLGKNFLLLLTLSAIIAIPATWVFFTKVVLVNVVYHNPIGFLELFTGAFVVGAIALTMVIAQSLRVAKKNPVDVLRSE